jgi:SanA protein
MNFISRHKKKILIWFVPALIILLLSSVISFYYVVSASANQRVYTELKKIPYNKAGLLLGTSKYTGPGLINQYYQFRIDAAVALFKAGKIDYIIVSGDNRYESYNEPREMRKNLIEAGVPEDRIILDFAGFRTLDSVIRSKEVFGQQSITIISQTFQIERAIYIAVRSDINAIGFAARDVSNVWAYANFIREYLARVKLMMDIYLFNTQPKFLGEKIEIPVVTSPSVDVR